MDFAGLAECIKHMAPQRLRDAYISNDDGGVARFSYSPLADAPGYDRALSCFLSAACALASFESGRLEFADGTTFVLPRFDDRQTRVWIGTDKRVPMPMPTPGPTPTPNKTPNQTARATVVALINSQLARLAEAKIAIVHGGASLEFLCRPDAAATDYTNKLNDFLGMLPVDGYAGYDTVNTTLHFADGSIYSPQGANGEIPWRRVGNAALRSTLTGPAKNPTTSIAVDDYISTYATITPGARVVEAHIVASCCEPSFTFSCGRDVSRRDYDAMLARFVAMLPAAGLAHWDRQTTELQFSDGTIHRVGAATDGSTWRKMWCNKTTGRNVGPDECSVTCAISGNGAQ